MRHGTALLWSCLVLAGCAPVAGPSDAGRDGGPDAPGPCDRCGAVCDPAVPDYTRQTLCVALEPGIDCSACVSTCTTTPAADPVCITGSDSVGCWGEVSIGVHGWTRSPTSCIPAAP